MKRSMRDGHDGMNELELVRKMAVKGAEPWATKIVLLGEPHSQTSNQIFLLMVQKT